MGCLTVNTYLGLNPSIANRLAGVIYSAPFFSMSEQMNIDPVKRIIVRSTAGLLDEFVMFAPLPLHKVCRDRRYMRTLVPSRKATPFLSMGLCASFLRNHDRVLTYANDVKYPYLMVLGEKDEIVNNKVNRLWHGKTSSAIKQIKLMPGALHELSKEPNSGSFFEASLKFMA